MFFKSSIALAMAALAAVAVNAQGNDTQGNGTTPAPSNNNSQSILDVIKTDNQSTQLLKLLNSSASSVLSTLQGGNNTNATYTFFAPTDTAFTPQVLALLPSISDVTSLINYHIINGTHHSTDFQEGANIYDSILSNSSLLKWSNGSGLPIDIYKNSSAITLFAGWTNASVVKADVVASNGVIHYIDKILNYPQSPSSTVKNVAGLTKFQEALNQTGLLSTVDGYNGATIFAPSDDAFSDFNASAYDNNTLTNIIKYHILNAVYYSTNITNLPGPVNVTAANGSNLTIQESNSKIQVGNTTTNAKVITPDVLTDNGVIHIIDTILFPPANSSNNNTNSHSGAGSLSPFVAMVLTVVVVASTILV
jgi:uncharacterized surface protein with fasciclin (FAS1) repeats